MNDPCPKCGGNPLKGYTGDELYEKGAYNVEVPAQIDCGDCGEPIWMKPYESISFNFAETEDDL